VTCLRITPCSKRFFCTHVRILEDGGTVWALSITELLTKTRELFSIVSGAPAQEAGVGNEEITGARVQGPFARPDLKRLVGSAACPGRSAECTHQHFPGDV
jgi:hypothetical protein